MNLNNIKNKLVDLHDQTILHNLENYIYNLHRINKEHRFFKDILNKNIILNEAEYVLYPNINKTSQTDKIFLSKTGKTLLYYHENVSEFILLPFEEDDYNYDEIFSSMEFEDLINLDFNFETIDKKIEFNFNKINELTQAINMLKNNSDYSKKDILINLGKALSISKELKKILNDFSKKTFNIKNTKNLNNIIENLNSLGLIK